MSNIDNGGQQIIFDYKYPLKGAEFLKLFRDFLKPGFYSGGNFSTVDGNQIILSPFRAILNSSFGLDNTLAIPIYTTSSTILTGDLIDPTKPILSATYTYLEEILNFLDFHVKAVGDPAIQNEIIIGTVLYDGLGKVIGLDTSNRTLGLLDSNYNLQVEGDALVKGDLTVEGTIEYVTELRIKDRIATVNDGEIGSGVTGGDKTAGIEVDRGLLTDQKLLWNENTGKWEMGETGSLLSISSESYADRAAMKFAIIFGG